MFRQEQTKGLYTDHDEINQILNRPMSGEVLVDHPEVWDMPVQIVDVNKMFDLADVINLETMLARSAGNLAWLRRFGSNGQRINKSASVLRKVAETESMLAPLMEIIGFHKMAMALNDVNMQIRLYNSGNGYVVEAAREIVGQLPSGEALSLEAENIIRDLFGDNLHEEVTKNDDSGLFMREGFIEPDIDPDVMKHAILRLIIRRKTDGAIARKLREYDLMGKEGTPMDILGATILAESEEQIPALFSRALESVKENPAYKPQPSPSRDYPVHVQGPAEFLNRLPLESIKAINGRDWQLPEPSDGFQVAKVTFLHGATPCEVQIITKAGRVENNLGERTSHISHEARKAAKARIVRQGGIIVPGLAYVDTTGWEEKLHRINARRNYMSGVVINKQSEAGADVIARGLAPNRRGMGGVIKQLQNL
jgi:hypothetical protein